MLRQELFTRAHHSQDAYISDGPIPIPLPIKKNDNQSRQRNIYEKMSQYGVNPFLPSSSPPVSDFLKRLAERNMSYNNSANLSKLERA